MKTTLKNDTPFKLNLLEENALYEAREFYKDIINAAERLVIELKRNQQRFETEIKDGINGNDEVAIVGWAINEISNFRPRIDLAPKVAVSLALAANIKK